MRCKNCHYSLANLTENRCPECGREFDPDDPSTYESEPLPNRPRVVNAVILFIVTLVLVHFIATSAPRPAAFAFERPWPRNLRALPISIMTASLFVAIFWLPRYLVWHYRTLKRSRS